MDPDVYTAAMLGIDRSPPSERIRVWARPDSPFSCSGRPEPPQEEPGATPGASVSPRVPQADVRRMKGAPHLMISRLSPRRPLARSASGCCRPTLREQWP